MPSCAVKWCRSRTDTSKCTGISFHKFPPNKVLGKKWMAAVRLERNEPAWKPSRSSKVCSMHFQIDDYCFSKKARHKQLRDTAVPFCTMVTPVVVGYFSESSSIKLEFNDKKKYYIQTNVVNEPGCSYIIEKWCKKEKPPRAMSSNPTMLQPKQYSNASTLAKEKRKRAQDPESVAHKIQQKCPKCYTVVPMATQTRNEQVRSVIAKVYHFLEQEYSELKSLYPHVDLSPLSSFSRRAAAATGVTEPDVLDILREEADRLAVVDQPPSKRARTLEESSLDEDDDDDGSSDDDESDKQTEDVLEEPRVYIEEPIAEPNPLVDFEVEPLVIKEEMEDTIDNTVPETVCIPKQEPPDEPHSQDINVQNMVVDNVSSDEIVRRDKQRTESQPPEHVSTSRQFIHEQPSSAHSSVNVSQLDPLMTTEIKQEDIDIDIDEEGVS